MSTPYPPQPRRLMRDPSKKLIGGVCSGLAKYLNMDVTLVRILTVVITLFTGIPIVLYLIALFVMPEEGTTTAQPPHVSGPQQGAYGAGFPGSDQQPTYGAAAQPPVDQVWGPGGAPWEQPQGAPAPAAATTAADKATPQTWTQPSAPEPTVVEPTSTEPTEPETGSDSTSYDTAPATPAEPSAQPTDPASDTKA